MQFGHEQLDVYQVSANNAQGKEMLFRIVSMLTKLEQRSHEALEHSGRY